MLLLKDSLKGKSDSAIKGIQLVPQNYNWMIDALKKKYGNKPDREQHSRKLLVCPRQDHDADQPNGVSRTRYQKN
ncbi:hypothetical protein OESDEN_23871 [Oesophagostomum dentatum]|uniref:Uncharacterized protein n=1 Tax=Oesophagostomum dentatum TaxID=61180 RepID=A0A0B1RV05_OESDE|nr:hypothetical protein OESDEN_23871 [Oesophagostomum dentatum]